MSENDKPANEQANPDAPEKQRLRRAQPGAAGLARNADGRRSSEQLKRNQERLGVGADHRTDSMKKGKRGTFP